jgi:hypothetical protein
MPTSMADFARPLNKERELVQALRAVDPFSRSRHRRSAPRPAAAPVFREGRIFAVSAAHQCLRSCSPAAALSHLISTPRAKSRSLHARPGALGDLARLVPFAELASIPHATAAGCCHDVVLCGKAIDLTRLPILTTRRRTAALSLPPCPRHHTRSGFGRAQRGATAQLADCAGRHALASAKTAPGTSAARELGLNASKRWRPAAIRTTTRRRPPPRRLASSCSRAFAQAGRQTGQTA